MTDPWATRVDAEPPRQGISPAMIAVIATSVAVLAIVGATGGYLLANAGPEPSPTAVTPATSPEASATPTYTPSPILSASPTASVATGALPPGVGRDFREYFAQLRAMKLGVVLFFGQEGQDGLVTKTEPTEGTSIHAGITVKVYVAGAPPETQLPNVVGLGCRDARVPLGTMGLLPTYKTGQTGVVLSQFPDPAAGGTARWNDHVELTCGTATADPSASPSAG